MNEHQLIAKSILAKMMDTSEQTISNKMHQGKEGIDLPYALKIGTSYKWKLGTVMKFIDEKEHERKVLLTRAKADEKPVSKIQINRL